MKALSIIALICVFFPVKPAHARTLPHWSKLDPKALADVVKTAKNVLREAESHESFSQNERERFRILNEAFAETEAYDCFYAGWPSQLKTVGGKKYCTHPKIRSDYPSDQCQSGELACNPAFFGPDLCISIKTRSERSRSFARCEQSFQKKSGSYDYLKNLTSKQAQSLDEALDLLAHVCETGEIGSQRSTKMCSSFLAKADRLKESEFYRALTPAQKMDSVTDAHPSTTPKGKTNASECCTVPNPPRDVAVGHLSDLKDAIQKNSAPDIRDLYDRLKKKFEASPLCRIQSTMTNDEKLLNGVAHYTKGLAGIVDSPGSSESFVQNTAQELGLDASWSERYSKIKNSDETTRRAFKYDFAKKILSQLKSDPDALNTAIEGAFNDRKMANCRFVGFDAFQKAMTGYLKLKDKKASKSVLSIVDFTLPYAARRMFVIDVDHETTLDNTWVSSGGGDGAAVTPDGANPKTSDRSGSMESTQGFVVAKEKDNTQFGRIVRLDGVESSNGNLRSRGIYLHSWPELQITPYNQYHAYYPDLPKRVEQLAAGQVSSDPSRIGEIDGILNAVETNVNDIRVQYTDGCLGVTQYQIPSSVDPEGRHGVSTDLIRDDIAGGSVLFFYTGPSQHSKYF